MKNWNKQILSVGLGSLLAVCGSATQVHADDTEVFFGQIDPSLQIFPNVLFLLDTSGSMNSTDSGVTHTRLTRMKDALDTILTQSTNVNIGLMRFNGTKGGGPVLYPLTYIDEPICDSADCGDVDLISAISRSNDDAEDPGGSSAVSTNGNVLTIGDSGSGSQTVGLRFNNIDIPSGATITSAVVDFTAYHTDSNSASFQIQGELIGDSPEFTTAAGDINDRDDTVASVTWVPGDWYSGSTYATPQINSVVQELVNQSTWCGGQDISLVFHGTGDRDAASYDYDPNIAPKLRLTYDSSNIPAGGGCVNKQVIAAISQSSDDVEERLSNNQVYRDSSDLEFAHEGGSTEQLIGLRFNNLDIPPNATITRSYIEFEVDQQRSGSVSMNIWGHDTNSAWYFKSKKKNVSKRTKTSAKVEWDDLPDLSQNSKVQTPQLNTIIEEITSRSGWNSGNSMAFILGHKSGSGYREYESYDGETQAAARLYVEYNVQVNASAEPVYITARDKMKQIVTGMTATGGTPIVDVMYEAAKYYRGEEVDYGRDRGYYTNKIHRVSTPLSYTGGTVSRSSSCTDANLDDSSCASETINNSATEGAPTYISPMVSSCQANHIVVLSDGEPQSISSVSKVKTLMGATSCEGSGNEQCGNDLAAWLQANDQASGVADTQNITTHTIGLNLNSDFLSGLATAGGGTYQTASSASELVSVFTNILAASVDTETSFVAPGATVNQFNRLTHRDDIYFSLFKPKERPSWEGNLKKYRLALADDGIVRIHDSSDPAKLAVNTQTGYFADNITSYWSDVVDGNTVAAGGSAGELSLTQGSTASARRVFTYTGANPTTAVNLNQSGNRLHEDNTGSITKTLLDIDGETNTVQEDLIKWARGVDIDDLDKDGDNTDIRNKIGDPMHSRPLIVNYATSSTEPDSTVYVTTNEGFLHAVDHSSGEEKFSYIPKELLKNLRTFKANEIGEAHPYGLDGPMSVLLSDENKNTVVDGGETAWLYMGMRRGGKNYYSVDVTDRENPKLRWIINGGSPGFEQLSQTWSKMVPATINVNGDGSATKVLIFAGGYDTNQDRDPDVNADPRKVDNYGRAIYIVNAETGAKIWTGYGTGPTNGSGEFTSFSDMKYSMPSDVRVIDVDFDGLADQFWIGDMGGQVWRFDIANYDTSAELVSGGVMADFSVNDSLADARKFFYEPDIALISDKGKKYLSVAIGSGWRSHPLNKDVNDEFYMIRVSDIYSAPAGYGKIVDSNADPVSYTKITTADLTDVTSNVDTEVDWDTKAGWKLSLEASGEKVLARSLTSNNQIIFTSYLPDLTVTGCETAIGGGRVYTVDILTGKPTLNLDNEGKDHELTESDRHVDLIHGGIPPEPAPLMTSLGDPIILVGPEQPLDKFDFGRLTQRTYWVEPKLTELENSVVVTAEETEGD